MNEEFANVHLYHCANGRHQSTASISLYETWPPVAS